MPRPSVLRQIIPARNRNGDLPPPAQRLG